MIQTIESQKRYHADHGWLDTRWHFSFGDYYDPANLHWGALRVFNDDIIKGGGGFDMHPHRDMEIISVVTDGALRHMDNLGNTGVLRPGEVQVMSAGSGIVHAEFNDSQTDPTRLLQIWIMPGEKNFKPRWAQQAFDPSSRVNQLQPVVSGGEIPGTLPINQDARIYLSTLDAGKSVSLELGARRHVYLFVITGQLGVNGKKLSIGDQARIADEKKLEITGVQRGDFILLDVP